MESKYYAIGEKFFDNDSELMVVKDIDGLENNCIRCHFNDRAEECHKQLCNFEDREDVEDVHFVNTNTIN